MVGELTAETLTVVAAMDTAYAVRMHVARMGIAVQLEVLTDFKQLYSTLQVHGSVLDRRLMLDIAALRQMLRRGRIAREGFVRSEHNLADGLIKPIALNVGTRLTTVLLGGQLKYFVTEFLPRDFKH
jgi:hypothetical protein